MTEVQAQLNEGVTEINIFDVIQGIEKGAFRVIVENGEVKVAASDQILEIIPNVDEQLIAHLHVVIMIARHMGMEFSPEVLAMAAAQAQQEAQDVKTV